MLSTMEPLLGVTDDDKKSPALIKLYDFTKGGTGIVDQKIGLYFVKTRSWRCPSVAFSYLLDTNRVNPSTVYALNNNIDLKRVNSFNFGFQIAESLVLLYIFSRPIVINNFAKDW